MPVYKKHNGKPVVGYKGSEKGLTDPITADVMLWYYQNPDGTDGEPVSLKNENDMLGRMGYQKAKDIRKQSFSDRMAENLIAGGGIGESLKKTISEKSKARMTGIKEAFDPLNIVKKLTGGSRLATSLFGKMTGRSKEHLEYFAGDPKKRKLSQSATTGIDPETLQSSTECLGRIYELLKQDKENKKLQLEKKKSFGESVEEQEELRNQELVKALTARRKKKEKTPTEEKEQKKTETDQKQTKNKSDTDKKKSDKKTDQKNKKEDQKNKKEEKKVETADKKSAEKVKKEETKQTAKKQETETKEKKVEVPKVEKVTPKEVPKPAAEKVPQVKPPPAKVPLPTNLEGTKKMIMQHEGKINFPYKDSKGLWTIGVGHLIGDGKTLPPEYDAWKNNGGPYDKKNNKTPAMTDEQVQALFDKDFEEHKQKAAKSPGWDLANESGQAAMIDLTYNMGAWWTIFKKAAAAAKEGDFNKFADELQYKNPETKEFSGWYQQVGKRADKIVGMIREGKKTETLKKSEAVLPVSNTGAQIDRASTENKDLKQSTKNDRPSINVNNNVNTTSHSPTESNTPTMDDRSSYQKKVKGN